jgi:hypothetical protein
MATSSSKAIRDRIITVVNGITPTLHAELPFVAYRDESGADFRRWARAHPQLCTRRVQARVLSDEQGDIMNEDVEEHLATFEVIVAYAHRWRAGASFDRDNVMEEDRHAIEDAIGVLGAANFTPATADATWREHVNASDPRESDEGVDFLVIRQLMSYLRAV